MIVGIDEAGTGALCGPVFAGCVILKEGHGIVGLNDSKKITETKRESLFDEITEKSFAWGIGQVTVKEIEDMNVLRASHLAMQRALRDVINMVTSKKELVSSFEKIIVDGNKIPYFGDLVDQLLVVAEVKGDARFECVSAASILAKVSRDRVMLDLSETYPLYNLDVNKGYGVKGHIESIQKYGASDIHRKSFLTKILKPTGKFFEPL